MTDETGDDKSKDSKKQSNLDKNDRESVDELDDDDQGFGKRPDSQDLDGRTNRVNKKETQSSAANDEEEDGDASV